MLGVWCLCRPAVKLVIHLTWLSSKQLDLSHWLSTVQVKQTQLNYIGVSRFHGLVVNGEARLFEANGPRFDSTLAHAKTVHLLSLCASQLS